MAPSGGGGGLQAERICFFVFLLGHQASQVRAVSLHLSKPLHWSHWFSVGWQPRCDPWVTRWSVAQIWLHVLKRVFSWKVRVLVKLGSRQWSSNCELVRPKRVHRCQHTRTAHAWSFETQVDNISQNLGWRIFLNSWYTILKSLKCDSRGTDPILRLTRHYIILVPLPKSYFMGTEKMKLPPFNHPLHIALI